MKLQVIKVGRTRLRGVARRNLAQVLGAVVQAADVPDDEPGTQVTVNAGVVSLALVPAVEAGLALKLARVQAFKLPTTASAPTSVVDLAALLAVRQEHQRLQFEAAAARRREKLAMAEASRLAELRGIGEFDVALVPLQGPAQAALLTEIRRALGGFPGLVFEANTFLTERVDETISGYAAPVVVNLYGNDHAALDSKAREIAALMRKTQGASGVQWRAPANLPVIPVQPLLLRMGTLGVSVSVLNTVLGAAQRGLLPGQVPAGPRLVDAILVAPPTTRAYVSALRDLPLRGSGPTPIRLGDVALVEQINGRYNVLHRNGKRLQSITCSVHERDVGSFTQSLMQQVAADIALPADMQIEFTGAAIEQAEPRRTLLVNALLASVAVLGLIGLALGSFRHALLNLLLMPALMLRCGRFEQAAVPIR